MNTLEDELVEYFLLFINKENLSKCEKDKIILLMNQWLEILNTY